MPTSTPENLFWASPPSPSLRRARLFRPSAGLVGLSIVLWLALPCLLTLPWSIHRYDLQRLERQLEPPSWSEPLGTDLLGRSLLWRCLLGGSISLGIGLAAALIAVFIGVSVGALAGYAGGRLDSLLMRSVDVLYGLPYILLVVLLDIALNPAVRQGLNLLVKADLAQGLADVVTLLLAIGALSWLTMARVIRGQVLSLKAQPFIEAARAAGLSQARILLGHILPNLVGPIVVYTTLTVPNAILQESFLSFLGIGVQAPLPSWGNLAADGIGQLHALGTGFGPIRWWLVFWPCALLGLTLLALNLLGEALRRRLDPHRRI